MPKVGSKYWDIYLAHRFAAYQAYGGSIYKPEMSPEFLSSLYQSWMSMYNRARKEVAGAASSLTSLSWVGDMLTRISPDAKSHTVDSLDEAWTSFKKLYDREAGDWIALSTGRVRFPADIWGALGPLASRMDYAGVDPTNQELNTEWWNAFMSGLAAGGQDVLWWVKVAALAVTSGFVLYVLR